jgi:hypothetical protein
VRKSENGAENLAQTLRSDRLSRGPETAWRIKPLFQQGSTWQVAVVFSRPIARNVAAMTIRR